MSDQSIQSALLPKSNTIPSQNGSKGQNSGKGSSGGGDDENLFISNEEGVEQSASEGSKGKAQSKADGEAPDFEKVFELLSNKNGKSGAGNGETEDVDGLGKIVVNVEDGGDAGASKSAEAAFARLLNAALPDNAALAGAAGSGQTGNVNSALKGGTALGDDANLANGKSAMSAADLLLSGKDQGANGTAANGLTNGSVSKPGLFDAYAVETRATSAFDKIVPIVKETVLSPTQQAMKDGFTVLRQETHFAPTATLDTYGSSTASSVLQQIGNAIGKELVSPSLGGDGASSPSSTASSQTAANSSFRVNTGSEALRVLDIQLHPADLGKVRLSIRLNENSVDVRVEASNAATAKLLESNKQALDQLLHKAGYRADHISIVAIDDKSGSQITPPSNNNSAQNQANGQGNGASFGSQGESNSGDGGNQQTAGQNAEIDMGLSASGLETEDGHNETGNGNLSRGITL